MVMVLKRRKEREKAKRNWIYLGCSRRIKKLKKNELAKKVKEFNVKSQYKAK